MITPVRTIRFYIGAPKAAELREIRNFAAAMANKIRKSMLPLVMLTLAGFTFNTSELVPIGLLSGISADLGISEPRTALVITVYAWVVALMSLPLMLAFARTDFRKLMTGVIAVFVISHAGTVLSTGYWGLMVSRVGVALAHSLFWSIAPAMAVAVTPAHKRAVALSALVAGGGIALVAGLPLGRVLGLLAGWRTTFGALGLLAAVVGLSLWRLLPPMPPQGGATSESRREMIASLWHCRPLLMIYLVTAVMITGHYTGYSYIEPFMIHIAGLSADTITLTLALFGVAGLAGSWLMSVWFARHRRPIITATCVGLPAVMLCAAAASHAGAWAMAAICLLWGMAITIYNIIFQNEIVSLFPHDSAVPMSLYSGIFNLGIGAGAFAGGIVVGHGMLGSVCYIGGGVALCGAVYCLCVYMRSRQQPGR